MNCQLNESPMIGRCCCNCANQMLAMKHPWSAGAAKGGCTEVMGALCAEPSMPLGDGGQRTAVFFDSLHGMCEMHEHRKTI